MDTDSKQETTSNEQPTFISVPLLELSAEKVLPGDIYLCVNHKMVKFRNKEDKLELAVFDRFIFNKVKYVFIEESQRTAFQEWILANEETDQGVVDKIIEEHPDAAEIINTVVDQRRAMLDVFESPRDEKQVQLAIQSSKKLVSEMMKKPFSINNITILQNYSKGAVDHSVNVSVLSVFLGLRMGYSHQLILENLSLGGLFHDLGKALIEGSGEKLLSDDDPQMQQHPKLGAEYMDKGGKIPNEVRMIIAQHHEFVDGTGYPAKIKGLAIYDLAKLVAIANLYDNLISKSELPSIKERAAYALDQLEQNYQGKFDSTKLEKIVKILRYCLL